eukprot:4686205-Prymnesium_polylepis.1
MSDLGGFDKTSKAMDPFGCGEMLDETSSGWRTTSTRSARSIRRTAPTTRGSTASSSTATRARAS